MCGLVCYLRVPFVFPAGVLRCEPGKSLEDLPLRMLLAASVLLLGLQVTCSAGRAAGGRANCVSWS